MYRDVKEYAKNGIETICDNTKNKIETICDNTKNKFGTVYNKLEYVGIPYLVGALGVVIGTHLIPSLVSDVVDDADTEKNTQKYTDKDADTERNIQELTDKKFNLYEEMGFYSGLITGTCIDLLYFNLIKENPELFLIPLTTNIISGGYEFNEKYQKIKQNLIEQHEPQEVLDKELAKYGEIASDEK